MRHFLKQFGLFCAIQLTIASAILWSYWRQYPSDDHFLASALDKESLLRTQASPRLIFIGGSSMAFGVHSAEIAAACGRRPVNMGLHAALGLKFMLNEVEPFVRANDWIIVAPEYQQFVRSSGQSEMLVNMLEINPASARYFDPEQWASAFDIGFIQRFGKMTRAVLGRPGRFFRSKTISRTRMYYRRGGFNRDGDVVAHLTEDPRGIKKDKEFAFRYRHELVAQAIDQINQFSKSAETRGARVFFSHPPLPREVFERNRAMIERLDTEMKARLAIPQLDTTEDLVFPIDHFFDTWYHLAAPGVDKRTKLLASRLTQRARNSGETKGSAEMGATRP